MTLRTRHNIRRGATLTESLVVAGTIAILVAVSVPVLAHVTTTSGEARSLSNLRILASAHEAYAKTFNERQLTFVPDWAGVYNGSCTTIITTVACIPQLILGADPTSGAIWGFYLGGGLCASYPGSCAGNWPTYKPIELSGPSAAFGSFRLGNAAAFNDFVEGRFYSDTFYAPNDALAYHISAKYRDKVVDFTSTGGEIAYTSYCMSPAAMWHPDVFSDAYGGYRDPNTFAEGYASPSVTQCLYPELKTRLVEHNWNDNAPGVVSTVSAPTAFPFNASADAAPFSVFFDGHIARLPNSRAIADDEALFQSSGQRLWSRTTPFGAGGYLEAFAFDPPGSPRTSHTILTTNGILGRDVTTAR